MAYVDFMSVLHKSTQRDYLARVNEPEFPKAKAAELAKKWAYGYSYLPGRWEKVAKEFLNHYDLPENPKVLDVGCGKGFLLFDLLKIRPDTEIYGIDISEYAIANAKEEIKDRVQVGNATSLPWADDYFDLVLSINTFHNLHNYELSQALKEFERVGKRNKYICVESYRNEIEKANLLYWQVTCEAFCTPKEWEWWFETSGYSGDHSFIYFE
jgi:ubiquinone/menaquinone biosynthesis C-methylase UbiE